MDRAEIYHQLTELFRGIFSDEDMVLTPEMKAGDVDGWDSLKMINIIVAVQKHFGVKVRSRDLDALRCVDDLVNLVSKLKNTP